MHAPFWQLPTLQGVPKALGLHLPFLHVFLPFFLSQSPFLQFSHSPHVGLHFPDLVALAWSRRARPSRPRPPLIAAARATRREPAAVSDRARLSKRSASNGEPFRG